MKKYRLSAFLCKIPLKYDLKMRLTTLLLLVSLFTANANSYSQNTKITLHLENVSVEELFTKIESLTDFHFLYNHLKVDVNRKVSVSAEEERISDILKSLFSDTDIFFKVRKKLIVLKTRDTENKVDTVSDIGADKTVAQASIQGTITDQDGQPLPGANILEKGTTNGTQSDFDGNFSLDLADASATLVVSYIGFSTREVPVNGQTTLEIALQESASGLDEVVVTALGIKRSAKSLGYSTTKVDIEELGTSRATNFGNSLQGKVAGVNVSPPASGPGGSSKIRIRGQSSFGGDNSPLIVVNGVPINNITPTGEARSDGGDGLQSINQEDVASITVLKGAAASALYGFRAKDGAIIITTKTGAGSTGIGIEFNSSYVASEALDYTDFQTEYGQGENGLRPATSAEATGSGTWNFGEKFDGAPTPQFDGQLRPYSLAPSKIKNFYRTGSALTNSIALSGGNENSNYRLSFSNTDAESIMPNSSYNKKIINLGLNFNLTDKLSASISANYSKEKNRNPPQFSIEQWNPNSTIYLLNNSIDVNWIKNYYKTADGLEAQLSRFPEWSNPYWIVNERKENIKRDRLFGNATLRYQFNDWLYAQGRVSQDYYTRPYDHNVPTGTLSIGQPSSGYNGQYYQGVSTFREYNLDFIIGANHTVGNVRFDITAGGNKMKQVSTNNFTSVENFFIKPLYTVANGQSKSPGYDYAEKKVNSFFGAAEIAYKNYLYLNVTARNDWFSTLNPDSNSYLYPSVSTSFVFSDALNVPSWLQYGKLRAAYAEVGSDTDPYSQGNFYSLNSNALEGNALGNLGNTSPNPDLRPLKVKEIEVGLELQMLDRRLNLDLSVYKKNTIDEILPVDISDASGYEQTVINVGKLQNQGVEMLLSLTPIRGNDFEWETTFNGSYNISEVISLADDQEVFNVGSGPWYGWLSHQVGEPLSSVRGYDYKRDSQGRILTTNGKFLQGDIVNYGSSLPKWVGSWINTIRYKGFKLFTQFDFKQGSTLLSNSNMNFMRTGQHKTSLIGREGGTVFPGVNEDGSPNTVAVPAQEFYTGYRSTLIATPFIYDSSFIRWRSLSIEYNATKHFEKYFKEVRLTANVYNVAMIKKHVDNLDPEAQGSVSDNLTGIEVHTLPTTRNYGLNLNIKF